MWTSELYFLQVLNISLKAILSDIVGFTALAAESSPMQARYYDIF